MFLHLQEVKPSPLALLAATCSKIGTGVDGAATTDTAGGQLSPLHAVIGSNQVIVQVGSDFLGQQAVQLGGLGTAQYVDISQNMATSGAKPQAMSVVNGTALSYGSSPLIQMSGQMIATPVVGPGGTIAYNLIQQPSVVVVDGQQHQQHQDAQAIVIQPQIGQTIVQTPNKQVIQTATVTKSPGATGVKTQGGTIALGNVGQGAVINLGTGTGQANMLTTAVRPANVVQAVPQHVQQTISMQIPVSSANGQTVYQTIQVPIPVQTTASPAPVTMFNLFPQQTITLAAPQTATAMSVPCDGQIQTANVVANQVSASGNGDASGTVKYITVQPQQVQQPQQQQQHAQQVYSIATPTINSAGGAMSPVTMVLGAGPATGTGAEAVQNILLPNGQVVQAVNSNMCQNVQVVNQMGQVVSGNWTGQAANIQVGLCGVLDGRVFEKGTDASKNSRLINVFLSS